MTVAVLAIAAASAAAAQAKEFHSENQVTFYRGSALTAADITLGGGAVKCSTATFEGQSTATGGGGVNWTIPAIEVAPTYGGCLFKGVAAATIATSGCQYKLGANNELIEIRKCFNLKNGGLEMYGGIVIHVPLAGCYIRIPNQVPG
ncbi:MAG TPA: hypothetical protein VGG40_09225, partial [Solirubrobacterales bacterium]